MRSDGMAVADPSIHESWLRSSTTKILQHGNGDRPLDAVRAGDRSRELLKASDCILGSFQDYVPLSGCQENLRLSVKVLRRRQSLGD